MIVGKNLVLPDGDRIFETQTMRKIPHAYIYDEMHGRILCVMIHDDLKHIYDTFSILYKPEDEFLAQTIAHYCAVKIGGSGKMTSRACIYMLFNNSGKPHVRLTIGTIAHEAEHCRQMIWRGIGENEDGCVETKAYFVEWLVDQMLQILGIPNKIDLSKCLIG